MKVLDVESLASRLVMLCTLHSRRNAGYSINSFVVAPAEKAVRDAPRCLGVSDAQVHEYVHAYCTLAAGVGSNSVASKRNGNDSHPKGGAMGGEGNTVTSSRVGSK